MKKLLLLGLLLLGAVSIWAESDKSLDDMLGDMAEEIGKSYINPFTEGFCTNMNAGWFNKAPENEKLGLDIDLSLVAMGTSFEDKDKTFDMTSKEDIALSKDMFEDLAVTIIENNGLPDGYDKSEAVNELTEKLWDQFGGSSAKMKLRAYGPTVIGSKDDSVKFVLNAQADPINVGGKDYYLDTEKDRTINSGVTGFDLPIIPLAAFQISLGTLFGTKATFRFLPPFEIDEEIGKFSYYGGALQHNPKMFLPVLDILPFDLDVSGSYQIFKLGDIVKATGWTAGMNFSRKFGWEFLNVTPFVGFMLESSTIKYTYDYELDMGDGEVQTSSIEFEDDGPNSYRIPMGLGIRLGIINLSGEYYFAERSGFSANVALAF